MKSNYTLYIAILFSLLLLSGCQSLTSTHSKNNINPNELYIDHAFPKSHGILIETEEEIFAIDEEMRNMVNFVLKPERDQARKAKLLVEYIFSSNHIALSYDHNANVTAIEAFHGRKANCMSLTIMAYTLATEAGLNIKFQDIEVPEYWMREGAHQLVMGHVNLLITARNKNSKKNIWSNDILQIDFDPGAAKKHFSRKVISKQTIIAMFYNNKAAEALVSFQYDTAYAYLKAATLIAPEYNSPWGNLGVLYRLTDHYELAFNTYKYALSLNPNSLSGLDNLALLFKKSGNEVQAEKIQHKIHAKRLKNPHYHALLSNEALYDGDESSAIKHLKKAIKLESKYHEFHYDLAKIYQKTSQLSLAKSSIKKALKLNGNIKIERKYNKKLNFLNQASVNY